MRGIRKHFIFIFMLFICSILLNQVILIKYGITLPVYLKYSVPLSKAEKQYLVSHVPIRLGTDLTAPPISYYDEKDKKYAGLIVDYVNFLSLETESPITIEMYPFYELVESLRKKEIDVCDMFPSEKRAREFKFSIPIYRLKTVIISPKKQNQMLEIFDLSGKKVAIPKGDLAEEYITEFLKSKKQGSPEFVFVKDTKTVLELLKQGLVEAAIGDEVVISTYWREYDVYETKKYNISLLYEKDVVLAVNKENSMLLSILNKGILQMKKNHIVSKVQQKWFGISESIRGEKRDFESFVHIAMILVLCLMGLYLWNYFLKKSVVEKTREIEENKKNINIILNSLDTALFIINDTNMIIECNESALKLLQRDKEKIIGNRVYDFVFLDELFKNHTVLSINSSCNFRNTFKNKCYEIKISPYISKEEILRILSIEDITERLIVERKLHQENKMITIGQISAGLAHEIRNPLGIIRNGLYLMKMKISLNSQEKAISMMESSIQRINNLIEHLLHFSRNSTDKCTQEDIESIVKNLITLMETKMKAKNIQYEFQLKGRREILINTETLNIVLINLIENSIDAFLEEKEDKQIKILISSEETSIYITIEDNGIGIPEKELDYIFDPFYTTKEEGYGTGLGLYLVYNEVKKYNGDILVESKVGIGTKFLISIDFQ